MAPSKDCDLYLVTALQRYVRSMLEKVPGVKVLILDDETTGILSLVYGQSEILEKEVYLVDTIDHASFLSDTLQASSSCSSAPSLPLNDHAWISRSSSSRESTKHLSVLYFLRPTADNILKVVKELKQSPPRFAKYHLYFSSTLSKQQLERLAKSDDCEVVQQVQSFFADIFVITPYLFSLELPSIGFLPLQQDVFNSTPYEESLFRRICDGLLSGLLCSMRSGRFLGIRFPRESEICRKIANQMQIRFAEESDVISAALSNKGVSSSSSSNGCLLLLFDRRDDPVTPLLNQWTYQAMTHELIGIHRNRVHLDTYTESHDAVSAESRSSNSNENSSRTNNGNNHDNVVYCVSTDPFLTNHWNSNFGDLGVAIQSHVMQYQQQTQSTVKIESLEEMRKFVDRYPEFRKISGNVSKHVAIGHELGRLVEMNGLLDLSLLEQQIVCSDNKTGHLKSILDRLRSPAVPKFEKLRLVLLFTLRYESDPYIRTLKAELKKSGIDENQVEIVDAVIQHAGSRQRGSELFPKMDFLQLAKSVVQRGFKGVPNVYSQHTPCLVPIVESIIKGRLRETQYTFIPHTTASYTQHPGLRGGHGQLGAVDRPSEILVFIVGGATYEEACSLHRLVVEHQVDIIVGGTTIHNSKTFLADIAQLNHTQQQQQANRHKGLFWDSSDASNTVEGGHPKQHQHQHALRFNSDPHAYSIPIDGAGGQEMVPIDAFSYKPAPPAALSSREEDLALKKEFLRQKW